MHDEPVRRRKPGAGRKAGSGPYGEPTTALRVPNSILANVREFLAQRKQASPKSPTLRLNAEIEYVGQPAEAPEVTRLPLYLNRISAGFPSPADDYIEERIDLNEQLIRNKAATFFLRVQGESMLGAGIHPGDTLVVDRSITPSHGAIVIAVLDGELTVKRLWLGSNGAVELRAENPAYPAITIGEFQLLEIWGVVTHVIHKVLP